MSKLGLGFGSILGGGGGASSSTPLFQKEILGDVLDYGNLYNGYAVDTGKLAPTGYRLPTKNDFDSLVSVIGSDATAGGILKSTRTDPTVQPRWDSPNTGAIDSFGFNALPSGIRSDFFGSFSSIGATTTFWTSTEFTSSLLWRRTLNYNLETFNSNWNDKKYGFSARFLRDATAAEQLLADGTYIEIATDEDGNSYYMVKIGTQVWSTSNLKTTKYNDGTDIPNITDNTAWTNDTAGAYCTYGNDPLSTYQDTIVNDFVIVPTSTMICSDNTLVIYNNAVLNSQAYSRVGNTYTFNFELQQGDILIFKN